MLLNAEKKPPRFVCAYTGFLYSFVLVSLGSGNGLQKKKPFCYSWFDYHLVLFKAERRKKERFKKIGMCFNFLFFLFFFHQRGILIGILGNVGEMASNLISLYPLCCSLLSCLFLLFLGVLILFMAGFYCGHLPPSVFIEASTACKCLIPPLFFPVCQTELLPTLSRWLPRSDGANSPRTKDKGHYNQLHGRHGILLYFLFFSFLSFFLMFFSSFSNVCMNGMAADLDGHGQRSIKVGE